MFGWFNTKAVEALAEQIAAEFIRDFPASGAEPKPKARPKEKGKGASATAKFRRGMEIAAGRASSFAKEQRPNIYQRAKLAGYLKQRFQDAGYDPLLIDEVVTHILMAMSQR